MKTNHVAPAMFALLAISVLTFINAPVRLLAESGKRPDSIVRVFVEYKLAKHSILTNDNIKVDVAGGTITLSGTVPTLHDRSEAEKIARKAGKSYGVVNELSVPAPSMPDSVLAAAVLKQVEDHVFYTAFDWLTVGVNNGVVTLHGWVSEPWEEHQYEEEASKVSGVSRIVNDLKTEMSFGYLRYRVARLIYRDPLFWQYSTELNPPIHIIVNSGTVILEGYVDSMGERGFIASQVTFRTDAIRVVNHLQVVSD